MMQKPGEKPAMPGEYEEVDSLGYKVYPAHRVTMEPGDDPLPPTREPGRYWKWVGPPQP